MSPSSEAPSEPPSGRGGLDRRFIERHFTLILIALLVALAAFAWSRRFVLDDAFISFRYARNLVEGHGLVFNAGERVEGYTNFLWTLILAAPIALGVDPVAFCYAIGPALSTLTLLFTALAALVLFESRALALLSVLLLGTNPSFAAFATGGLETMLAACLQTAVLWMALRAWKDRALSLPAAATLSVTAAAAILTRPDGAIVAGLGLLSAALVPFRPSSPARSAAERNPAGGKSASALASTERTSNQSPDTAVQGSLETADRGDRNAGGFERQSSGRRPMELAALALPAAAILGAWFVWKLSYYEALLPNTLAAKTGSSVPWAQGLAYLGIFFVSTWTFPVLFVTAAGFRRFTPPIVALVLTLAASFLYFVAVGGDFMEFRLFVPLLPILVLLVAWTVFRLVTQPEVRAALCVLVLGGWIHHAATFESARGVESIPTMVDHMSGPKGDWIGIGSRLGEIFEDARDVRIATSACGAIPFYSDLPVVDMLGLTDPWIPGHGVEIRREAGHTWVAPFSYLLKRRVNLVFGHPWVVTSSDPQELQPQRRGLAGFRYVVQIDPQELWSGSALLLIPLDAERSLAALYVTPHPAVERAIETNHWARFPLLGDVD